MFFFVLCDNQSGRSTTCTAYVQCVIMDLYLHLHTLTNYKSSTRARTMDYKYTEYFRLPQYHI